MQIIQFEFFRMILEIFILPTKSFLVVLKKNLSNSKFFLFRQKKYFNFFMA